MRLDLAWGLQLVLVMSLLELARQGSISEHSFSAEHFSVKFSSSKCRKKSIPKKHVLIYMIIMVHNAGFKVL
jgi:hypothetical protein